MVAEEKTPAVNCVLDRTHLYIATHSSNLGSLVTRAHYLD